MFGVERDLQGVADWAVTGQFAFADRAANRTHAAAAVTTLDALTCDVQVVQQLAVDRAARLIAAQWVHLHQCFAVRHQERRGIVAAADRHDHVVTDRHGFARVAHPARLAQRAVATVVPFGVHVDGLFWRSGGHFEQVVGVHDHLLRGAQAGGHVLRFAANRCVPD